MIDGAPGVRIPSSGWDGVHIERARGVEHSHLDVRVRKRKLVTEILA